MIGTIVNAIAIIIGSLVGGFFKRLMNENLNNRLLETMGLAAFGIGINSVVQNMPDSNYPVLFIASLALGCVAGTLLKIDEKANYTRVGGGLPKNIKFVDPEGGPFLSVEGTVEGKVITKIDIIKEDQYKDFIISLEDREDETSRFKN